MRLAIARTAAFLRRQKHYSYFDAIRDDLFAPAEEVRTTSRVLLRNILQHAYDHTRAYKMLMDQSGITPSTLTNLEESQRIPVTTKEDMRKRPGDYTASNIPVVRCQRKLTSGSSGTPFMFYRDPEYSQLGYAGTLRCLSLAGWEPAESIAMIWGYDHNPGAWWRRLYSLASGVYCLNGYFRDDATMRGWIRLIQRRAIRFLYGFPSAVADFARFARGLQADVKMRAVFLTAEKYFPFERRLIEEVFQCKSFDLYGSSEVQNIAFECTRGNMHISSDFVVLHQHEREGEPLPLLVATSLHSRSTPFIRYELGDYGRLLPGRCDCGVHTPLMEILGGRKCDVLLTSAGVPLAWGALERIFHNISGVSRYQIVQHSLRKVTLRVEIDKSAARLDLQRKLEPRARTVLAESIGAEVSIDFEYPAEIPAGRTGKFRFVVREE